MNNGRKERFTLDNVSFLISNKTRRLAMYHKLKKEKEQEMKKMQNEKKKLRKMLGDNAPAPKKPTTIDDMRLPNITTVDPNDAEVFEDQANDEFASYFQGRTPKILITTSMNPKRFSKRMVYHLLKALPNSKYFHRRKFSLKKISQWAMTRDYTDIIVITDRNKEVDSLIISHLPNGPTATFRITNVVIPKRIEGATPPTSHKPELILNNFGTRLGHTIGRMFAALFPPKPEFMGRQVVTLHNQRDFVFFRFHRYIFDKDPSSEIGYKVRIQELGPRFTLKLITLQPGLFDTKFGEYEFVLSNKMTINRKKMYL